MQNKETREAIKSIKRFVECRQDMTAVTTNEMKLVLDYIECLENKAKELGKGQQTLMQSRTKWKNRYYKQRQKQKGIKQIINNLKLKYEQLTQAVRRYEEMRRNCQADSFYKKSYQTTIHRLNAKREIISSIIEILEEKSKNVNL